MERIEYKIGDSVNVRGLHCTIVKAHPFGTLDVVTPSGAYLRVTGLPVYVLKGGR